jgi:hypothetical protein
VCGSILLPWWLRLVVDDNTALSQRPHTLVSWALVFLRPVQASGGGAGSSGRVFATFGKEQYYCSL